MELSKASKDLPGFSDKMWALMGGGTLTWEASWIKIRVGSAS